MLSVTLMMASRVAGDAVTPLRFMIFAVVLDIVFNPVLILGLGPFPRLGIAGRGRGRGAARSGEHTSELQSLMRSAYAGICMQKKTSNERAKSMKGSV